MRQLNHLSKAHRYIADERTSPGAPQIIALSLYPQALTIPHQLNPNSPRFARNTRTAIKDSEHRAVYIFSTLSKNYTDPLERNLSGISEK